MPDSSEPPLPAGTKHSVIGTVPTAVPPPTTSPPEAISPGPDVVCVPDAWDGHFSHHAVIASEKFIFGNPQYPVGQRTWRFSVSTH